LFFIIVFIINTLKIKKIHNGKDSGQEIPHVHVHLLPRSNTDSAGPVHSMFKDKIDLSDSEIDSLYNQLKII